MCLLGTFRWRKLELSHDGLEGERDVITDFIVFADFFFSFCAASKNQSSFPCTEDCQCGNENKYLPVCGADRKTYFSPCRAGCEGYVNATFYVNCTCVPEGTAKAGICNYTCPVLYAYLAVMAFLALVTALAGLPKVVVLLRSVDVQDKPVALGFSAFMVSLTGWIMAPLVFGHMIDGVCKVWEQTCKGRGSCLLYDLDRFRLYYYGVITVGRVGAFLFLVAAYVAARFNKRLDKQPDSDDSATRTPSQSKTKRLQLVQSIATMTLYDTASLPLSATSISASAQHLVPTWRLERKNVNDEPDLGRAESSVKRRSLPLQESEV